MFQLCVVCVMIIFCSSFINLSEYVLVKALFILLIYFLYIKGRNLP